MKQKEKVGRVYLGRSKGIAYMGMCKHMMNYLTLFRALLGFGEICSMFSRKVMGLYLAGSQGSELICQAPVCKALEPYGQ